MDDGNILVTIEHSPSIPNLKVVSINGTMDSITTRQVDETVFPVIEQENSNIIFDLSNVDYLSSTGILCLLKYVVSFNDQRRLLKFVKPPKSIYNTLVVSGIAKKFDMYDTIGAAITTLR
jgi:anti-sigma B factor antagonist